MSTTITLDEKQRQGPDLFGVSTVWLMGRRGVLMARRSLTSKLYRLARLSATGRAARRGRLPQRASRTSLSAGRLAGPTFGNDCGGDDGYSATRSTRPASL
jgi:hypothetical protein